MKPNRLHIFDKMMADSACLNMARGELEARVASIGLADRGIALDAGSIAGITDAVEAAREADQLTVQRVRRALGS